MVSIITFLIILSILVLIHELGHFWAAKKFGIKVDEFGVGYPPRVYAKKKGETTYSLNWLPFGGFVRLFGEEASDQYKKISEKDLKRAFFQQPKMVRMAVLTAGVVMNFFMGVVLFAAVYTKLGIPEQVDYLTVTGIGKDTPAEKAGLRLEDKIIGVVGIEWMKKEELVTGFVGYINDHRGEEVKLILTDGKEVMITPRLEEETPEEQGALGVVISGVDIVQYPYWQRPFRGIWVGLKEAIAWGGDILDSLHKTVVTLFRGKIPEGVAGPIGIYKISQGVMEKGLLATLQLMAILSINLAVLNLLPLPALDGGRLMFVAIESIIKKRIKPEIEQMVHLAGMALLIGLMILVTVNDIKRLVG